MGWVTDLLKDFPALSVAKERLALAEERQQALAEENQRLVQRVEELTKELEATKKAASADQADQEFRRYRGLLWAREGVGYEPTPYCPDCRRPMLGFPIPASPMQWLCRPCKRSVNYTGPPGA